MIMNERICTECGRDCLTHHRIESTPGKCYTYCNSCDTVKSISRSEYLEFVTKFLYPPKSKRFNKK